MYQKWIELAGSAANLKVTYEQNGGAAALEDGSRRIGDMRNGLPGIHQLYLQSIESGKFVVDAEHPGFGDGDGLVTQGWRVAEWMEKELGQVLDIWDSLVNAITARLPESAAASGGKEDDGNEGSQPKKRRKTENVGLITVDILNKYPAIPPFARIFLSRAKNRALLLSHHNWMSLMKPSSTAWALSYDQGTPMLLSLLPSMTSSIVHLFCCFHGAHQACNLFHKMKEADGNLRENQVF